MYLNDRNNSCTDSIIIFFHHYLFIVNVKLLGIGIRYVNSVEKNQHQ